MTLQNYPLPQTWRVNNISRLKSLRDLNLQVWFVVFYFLVPLNNVLYVCTYCICMYKLYKGKGQQQSWICCVQKVKAHVKFIALITEEQNLWSSEYAHRY